MICLLPELCSLPFFKVLVSVSICIPEAVESIISELLGNIFTSQCATTRHLSWCCGHCTKTLWGLSAADGAMQAAVLSSRQFSEHICCICLHTRLDRPTLRGQLRGRGASPKVCCLSDLRLECICWLENNNNNHVVLNHVVPSCRTRSVLLREPWKPHMCKLNEIQLLFLFRFFYFACMLYRLRMQKSNPLFFPLLIIQYCNIFNIK